jgi:hypothetical protein
VSKRHVLTALLLPLAGKGHGAEHCQGMGFPLTARRRSGRLPGGYWSLSGTCSPNVKLTSISMQRHRLQNDALLPANGPTSAQRSDPPTVHQVWLAAPGHRSATDPHRQKLRSQAHCPDPGHPGAQTGNETTYLKCPPAFMP